MSPSSPIYHVASTTAARSKQVLRDKEDLKKKQECTWQVYADAVVQKRTRHLGGPTPPPTFTINTSIRCACHRWYVRVQTAVVVVLIVTLLLSAVVLLFPSHLLS